MRLGPALVMVASFVPFVAARDASATETGQRVRSIDETGVVVVSASRVIPLVALNDRSVDAPANDGHAGTRLTFGSDPGGINAYNTPRIGFDATPARGLTVGSDFAAYATLGGSPSLGDEPQVSLFGVAPRVGWLGRLEKHAFVWLRGGVAYYALTEHGVNGAAGRVTSYSFTWKQLDFDGEVHLVFTPLPHLGVMAGAVAEVPVHGVFDETRAGGAGPSTQAGASWLHVALTAGLLAYL